jgi:erythromycin esterase-like protein
MEDRMTLDLAAAIRDAAHPLTGAATDYNPLLDLIGDARVVLIGEASHGTHEFYRQRALITRRLIVERGFTAVAVEADWPDAYRINRFVRGMGDGATAIDALAGFRRFPAWMWRNADVLDFVGWLRAHNDARPSDTHKAGFYGLDLYSLYGSIEAVLGYLDTVNPQAAQQARQRYGCFEQFGHDPQTYGYATSFGAAASCADAVVSQLVDLQRRTAELMQRDGRLAEDEFFFAEQNARLVKNAEAYYRTMFRGRESWNLRDTHMAETLGALTAHLSRQGQRQGRGLGAQLAPGRCPRHRDGPAWRAECRPAGAPALRPRRRQHRFQHLLWHRHGGFGLGRASRAQARPPSAAG